MSISTPQFEQATRFVGRQAEIEEVLDRLQDDGCRLITLIGVGGIGKTRLALRILEQAAAQYADGVCLVSLQPVQTRERLIAAIADELGLALSGQTSPDRQLVQYLATKHMLLLLDNFEQLRHAADVLTQIVRENSAVKLLVTSREALNVQDEWRYWLDGLPVPKSHETDSLAAYDAVRLFVDRAQHMRPDFDLGSERAGVVRICQLVEGMPLALEMAASWTKTMRCAEIAAEIQRNLTFLQSDLSDVMTRHRSMDAVFTQTWTRMPQDEQQLFKRLAVFRGGFTRTAAEVVASATLPLLSALVDRCLIRRDGNGRYQIHELLRQFAEEQLSEAESRAVVASHTDYYTSFLAVRTRGTVERTQVETSQEIERELENIRAAWQAAVDQQNTDGLAKAAAAYFYACQIQSRFLESAAASEQAVAVMERLGENARAAQVAVYWGWMLIRVGRFEQADEVLDRSRKRFEDLDLVPAHGMGSHPFAPLIILRVIQGRYDEAVDIGEELKRQSIAREDQHNLSFACYGLTSAYASLGESDAARLNAQQATQVCEAIGSRWFQAYCLIEWGKSDVALQRYAEAKSHFQAALEIRETFNDPEGIGIILIHLAEIACVQQDYATAREFCARSLAIYRNLNDQGGLASVQRGLGQIAAGMGKPAAAAAHYREALMTAASIHFVPLLLTILLDVADLLAAQQKPNRATSIYAVVAQHPAATSQQRQLASTKAEDLSGEHGTTDLDTLLVMLRMELADFDPIEPVDEQGLIDPLTPRELDVLRLIARGYSNPEIAEELILSVGTVKAHTNHIYQKLQVSNRVAAVEQARSHNLLNH